MLLYYARNQKKGKTMLYSKKQFIPGENRVYFGELPHHLAIKGVPKNMARVGFFRLDERHGNTLIFKTGDRFATRCYGKVLINAKTGMEACLIEYRYSRILLEAPKFARLSSPDVHKDNAPLHANAA